MIGHFPQGYSGRSACSAVTRIAEAGFTFIATSKPHGAEFTLPVTVVAGSICQYRDYKNIIVIAAARWAWNLVRLS